MRHSVSPASSLICLYSRAESHPSKGFHGECGHRSSPNRIVVSSSITSKILAGFANVVQSKCDLRRQLPFVEESRPIQKVVSVAWNRVVNALSIRLIFFILHRFSHECQGQSIMLQEIKDPRTLEIQQSPLLKRAVTATL